MKGIWRMLRYDWPLHFILLLTNWLPDNVIFLRVRGFLVRFFIKKCGSNLRLARNITFYNPAEIFLGNDVYIATGCVFLSIGQIFVGDEVTFGPYVVLSAGNHTRYNGSFRFGPVEKGKIVINNGVWIGASTTILSGSVVGKGSLIASNSAVARGIISQNSFVAGVPAKVKKIME